MNNYVQPYFGGQMQQPYSYQPTYIAPNPNLQQPITQMPKVQQTDMFPRLQGKSVDSIDVVKAMDIPLDGTISYFPLTDGTAIVTKQLQQDGTSKTIIYKPEEIKAETKVPSYITKDEFEASIKDLKDLKDTDKIENNIKEMKRQIEDIIDDMKKIKEKNRKD